MKRLILAMITLALSLGLLPEGPIRAQNQISNFHLSNVPDGPEIIEFASLTPAIYVIFDYTDADNLELTVKVIDGSGYIIFEQRDIYNGSGSRSLRVSGTDVFKKYKTLAQTYGTSMEGYIDQAVDASTPNVARALIELSVTSGTQLDGVIQILSNYDLSPAVDDHLAQALAYLDQALSEGSEIINHTITSDSEVHDRAVHMQSMARQALDEMEEALLIIEEGERPFLDGSYLTKIEKNSNLVDSIEWTVSPHGVEMPTSSPTPSPPATATRTPTRTPLPTATPTPGVSPTATRTPRPIGPTWTPRPSATPVPELPTATPTTAAYPGATPTPLPAITGTVLATPTATVVISTPTGATATAKLFPPATVPATPATPGTAPVQTPIASVTAPAEATETVGPPSATWVPVPTAPPAPPSGPLGSPLNTLGILGGAVALGLLALWIRKNLKL